MHGEVQVRRDEVLDVDPEQFGNSRTPDQYSLLAGTT